MTVGMKDLVLMFPPATSSQQEWREPGNDTLIEHHTYVTSSWMRRQRAGTWVYLLGEPIDSKYWHWKISFYASTFGCFDVNRCFSCDQLEEEVLYSKLC